MLFQNLWSGIKSLFLPNARNAEIEAEVQSFLEAAVEYRMQQGMSCADAERAARAEIRSAEMIRHNVWSSGWESRAELLWKDVRYSFRQLLRSPGLSAATMG